MTNDDDAIRSQITSTSPPDSSNAATVLAALKPAMRRARFRRHATNAMFAVTLLFVAGGAALALNAALQTPVLVPADTASLPQPDAQLRDTTVTEQADVTHTSTVVTTPLGDSDGALAASETERGSRDPVDATKPPTTESPGVPTGTVPQQPPVGTAPGTIPNTTATPVPTPPSSPATSPPTTATEAPTTTATVAPPTTLLPYVETISSDCGAIEVTVSGETVTLSATTPASGFEADIKNSGPETVEVGFSNETLECEIKATVQDGELDIDIEEPHEDDESESEGSEGEGPGDEESAGEGSGEPD